MTAPSTSASPGGGRRGPLLAIETSTPVARVAVLDGAGRVIAATEAEAARHSGNLLRLVDEALAAAGARAADLGGVACGAGPGSFTGLRVGLAAAKGLCLATGAPLLLVPSLQILAADLAAAAPTARLLVPCIDAGKGELYAGFFAPDGTARNEHARLTAAALAERLRGEPGFVVGGPGAARFAETLRASLPEGVLRLDVAGPTAAAAGRLARPRLVRGESDDLAAAVPIYGRPPDITTPKAPAPRR